MIGAAAVPQLIQALDAPNRGVRLFTTYALGAVGAPAVPALEKALRDKDPAIREQAAIALGKIGETSVPRPSPAWWRRLRDPSASVRMNAADSLGEVGAKAERGPCPPWLWRYGTKTISCGPWPPTPWVKSAAQARKTLIDTLYDDSPSMREIAAVALGMIGPDIGEKAKEAVPALVKALQDKSPGRPAQRRQRLGLYRSRRRASPAGTQRTHRFVR